MLRSHQMLEMLELDLKLRLWLGLGVVWGDAYHERTTSSLLPRPLRAYRMKRDHLEA